MKRFLASLFLLGAILTGGAFAQSPNVRSILLSGSGSCPASVRLASLPSQYQCPAVSLQLASGTAWVKGQGFVPLSSLLSITNATGGYVTDWSGAMTWKFGPTTNSLTNTVFAGGSSGNPPTNWSAFGTAMAPVASLLGGTAYQFNPSANRAFFSQNQGASANATYVFSVFVESNPNGLLNQDVIVAANLPAGATANYFPTNATTVAAAGARVSIVIVIAGTSGTPQYRIGAGGVGNVTGTVVLSQPQLELLSYPTQTVASPYIANASLVSGASAPAQLRQANGTGLLVEEARTNFVLSSQDIGASANWQRTAMTVGSTTAAPDPNFTAPLIIPTAVSTSHYVKSATTTTYTSGQTYSWSFYVKGSGVTQLFFEKPSTTAFSWGSAVTLNLATGAITQQAGVTATGEWAGNGFYRIKLTSTATGTDSGAGAATFGAVYFNAYGSSTGDGVAGAYLWGAQGEQRASTSSYCPTTSAAATCSADQITGLVSQLLGPNPSVATIRVNATYPAIANVFVLEGSSVTGVTMGTNAAASGPRMLWRDGTASRVDVAFVTGASTGAQVSMAVSSDNSSAAVGGINGQTAGASATPAQANWGSSLTIGSRYNGSSFVNFWNQPIQRLDFWRTALPQSALNTITTPQPVLVTDFANSIYRWNGYDLGAGALTSLFSVANSGGYCTTSAGLLVSFPSNTLRVCSGTGVLPEDTRTNVNLYSQAFENAAYNRQAVTVTADTTVAPDGTLTADTILDGVSNSQHFFQSGGTFAYVSGTAYTTSVYVLTSSYRYPQLVLPGAQFGGTNVVTFDLQTGAVINPVTGTGAIVQYSNGWSRLSYTATSNASGSGSTATMAFGNAAGTRLPTYTGANNSMVAWCLQTEVGSFPTSCMPTTASTATRNFDNIQALGPVLNLLGTQGANSMAVAYTESPYYATNAAPARMYGPNWIDGGNARWSFRVSDSTGGPSFTVGDGAAVSTLPASPPSIAAGTPIRSALRWSTSAADAAFSINGGVAATVARQFGGTLGSPFYIGSNGISGNGANSPLGCMGLFPGGLTNTQLQAPGAC